MAGACPLDIRSVSKDVSRMPARIAAMRPRSQRSRYTQWNRPLEDSRVVGHVDLVRAALERTVTVQVPTCPQLPSTVELVTFV